MNNICRPLVVDVASTRLAPNDIELLKHERVGGLIFFARNYESPEKLRHLVAEIKNLRPDLLLAVDQEGGRVQRFKEGFTRLPPLQSIGGCYEQDPMQARKAAYAHGWLMAAELLALGIDMSFAPVLDADSNNSQVIGDRAFSQDVGVVVELARHYIDGMSDAGMSATAKHFPGHGAVVADSHKELPKDSRNLDQIQQSDMLAFSKLTSQYSAVMPAHILFSEVDSQPVGFSNKWLQQILRGELGFKGVIFSDDLSMEGAAVAGDYVQRAKAALGAGCDGLLVCNHPEQALAVAEALSLATVNTQSLAKLKSQSNLLAIGLENLRKLPAWQNAFDLVQLL